MELDIDRDLTGYSGTLRENSLGELRFGTALSSYPQRRFLLFTVSGTAGINSMHGHTVWNQR